MSDAASIEVEWYDQEHYGAENGGHGCCRIDKARLGNPRIRIEEEEETKSSFLSNKTC